MQEQGPAAAREPSAVRQGGSRLLGALPYLVLVLALLFTAFGWRAVDQAVTDRLTNDFQDRTRDVTARLANRLHDDEQVLRGGVGLFQASGEVTRDEWRRFVSTLRLDENFPGIQGVGFSQWVAPRDLPAHLRRVRGEGFPGYQVRPPGERAAYTAIIYLEPFDWRNQRAFGFDMYSEPVRRAAMDRARDTGLSSLSGRIVLVQETETDRQHGVLLYLPVYRAGAPLDTVEQRRAALQGFVYSPIRVKDLVLGALGQLPRDLAFEVFAGGRPGESADLVFDSLAAEPASLPAGWRPRLVRQEQIELMGERWEVRFRSLPGFEASHDRHASNAMLGGGLLLSLLLFGATLVLTESRRRAVDSARALQEGEARYRTLFDTGPDGVVVVDPATGAFLAFNDRACAALGYAREEFARLSLREVDAREGPEGMWARLGEVQGDRQAEFDAVQRDRQGGLREVQVLARALTMGGRPVLYCLWRDVTERNRAEEVRRREEARFHSYFDLPLVGAAITSPTKGWLTVNDRLCTMLGYRREELQGLTWSALTHPEDLPLDEALFAEVVAGARDGYTLEKRFLKRSGEVLWASLAVQCVRDARGQVEYFAALVDDITGRKREQELVKARLALIDEAFTCSLEELLVHTLDKVEALTGSRVGFYHFVLADQETLSLQAWSTGTIRDYCRAEGKGTHYPVLQAGVWADCVRERRPVIHNDYAALPTKRGLPPGHAELTRELVVPVFRQGKIVATLGVGNKATDYTADDVALVTRFADLAWDVAERRLVLERLRESDARFAAAFERAPVMMTLSRLEDGRYLSVNQRFSDVSGFSAAEAVGRTSVELGWVSAEDRGRLVETLQADGRVAGVDLKLRNRSGRALTARFWGELLTVAGERCLLSIAQDVTVERDLQQQLAQSQKMESVGRLAGGVAHDFNNMLAVIIGHTDLLLRQPGQGPELREDLEEIADAAKRAAVVTRQLLAFARKQAVEPRILDLNETMAGMLKMLRRLIGEDVTLAWAPGRGLHPVRMDPSQVDQILANLCVNSRDAIAGVGRISIRTENVVPEEALLARHAHLARGPHVRLTLADDGAGIRPEVLPHIFEPFFTTKESGRGTGLGLATVYGIVRQNGGVIEVQSTVGAGTTFQIYLPAATISAAEGQAGATAAVAVAEAPAAHSTPASAAAPAGAARPDPLAAAPERRETVLLVEDEPAVLKLCGDLLRHLGYRVIPASSAGQAIQLAAAHAGEFQLLMTDVVMPDMSGRDLATMLVLGHPGLRTLFMSGYTSEAMARQGLSPSDGAFIQKPFTREELAAKVHEALGGAARAAAT